MRHKRIRDIVIELTSLLDVVMILIFAVMIKNAQLVEASNKEAVELQKENAAMQGELEKYAGMDEELASALGKLEEGDLEELLEKLHNAENQIDAYEYMDDIVIVYNVGLENRYNNTARCLTYGRASDENGTPPEPVKREDAEQWNYVINSLKLDVREFIDNELQENTQDKYIYLVFSYNPTKVYSNDYDDVNKVLADCETKYGDNVRYRTHILGESD